MHLRLALRVELCELSAGCDDDADTLLWYVAHTRPRREKKLAEYCEREEFRVTLPCYRAVHKYRGKTVTFLKPLFPGYVFLQLLVHQRQKVYQSDYVATCSTCRPGNLCAAVRRHPPGAGD